jgi:rubredoxin
VDSLHFAPVANRIPQPKCLSSRTIIKQEGQPHMQQDRVGWHFAPAGIHWCCPDCRIGSLVDDWSRCTIIDDNDTAEDARLCPQCGSIISASGSASIAA